MNETYTTATATTLTMVAYWKPAGRARRFDRMARGLARRLRIPWVRSTLWERDHPGSRVALNATTYGPMWTSNHALANYSFACTCHPNERYKRHPKHKQSLR